MSELDTRTAPVAEGPAGPVPGPANTVVRGGAAVAVKIRGVVNLVYAGFLLLGGVAPNPPAISQTVSDSTLHGAAYLIQTLLLFWLARAVLSTKPALASAALCAAAYSTLVELCQLLQPARSFEGRDLAANVAGVAVACAMVLIAGAATRRR